MARPLKKGLDYYPMFLNDDRFHTMGSYHGHEGFVVLVSLLYELHGVEGYYMAWNEKRAKKFVGKYGFKHKLVMAVIEDCCEEGYFDRSLLEQFGVLTSKQCQEVWLNVVKERAAIEYNPDYILIDLSKVLEEIEKRQENKKENKKSENIFDKPLITNDNSLVMAGVNYIRKPPIDNPPKGTPIDNTTSKEKKSKAEQSKAEKEEILNFSNSETAKAGISGNSENDEERASHESGNAPQTEGGAAKKKKAPHPARETVIKLWEKNFGLAYNQSLILNQAINQLIGSLEKNIVLHAPDIDRDRLPEAVTFLWENILSKWDKVDPFYQKQVSFDKIAKNFDNILIHFNGKQPISTGRGQQNRPDVAAFNSAFS